jgi:hypothetical protein
VVKVKGAVFDTEAVTVTAAGLEEGGVTIALEEGEEEETGGFKRTTLPPIPTDTDDSDGVAPARLTIFPTSSGAMMRTPCCPDNKDDAEDTRDVIWDDTGKVAVDTGVNWSSLNRWSHKITLGGMLRLDEDVVFMITMGF